jgi:hypothetical protein
MIRNVSLVNGQTDRLALPYRSIWRVAVNPTMLLFFEKYIT